MVAVQTFPVDLPGGIRLHCRAVGATDLPLVVFLHGFPEAAFVWDPVMRLLASHYRCVAPDLRGYGRSSAPSGPEAYRMECLVEDVTGLVAALQPASRPAAALVGHDWGGALAWAVAASRPGWMRRLLIINAPHPAPFLRDLQQDPTQQAASAYMNFMCRPDAERLLAENDFARLFRLFTNMGAADPSHPGGAWLDDAMRAQYREVWGRGLTGALNWYRASPLRPPTPQDPAVLDLRLPPHRTEVRVPTAVLWGMADLALPARLLDGLDEHVPDLSIERIDGATHWLIHERPGHVAQPIRGFLPAG